MIPTNIMNHNNAHHQHPPYAVWVIAKLRAGHMLNGEVDQVSEPYRSVARRLADTPVEERETILDEYTAGLPEREKTALIEAMAAVDPDAPPPEPPATEAVSEDAWGPLRLGEMPLVEPFPDIVLPDPVSDFIKVASNSIGCPPDFVGLPILVVAGAAIGRSASLQLKPGYFASSALYAMNVGGPSSGKSPAWEAAVKPMQEIDQALHDAYVTEKAAYDRASKAKEDPLPEQPRLQSAVLDDVTVEAVAHHLALNPRGLLVARDEGSAWVAGIGQYKQGRGADRQFWLSALFGKAIRVDRKGNLDSIPIRAPHPFVSVVGNLPPEMLGEFRERGGRSDGFIERILIAFPDPRPRPRWSETGIPQESTRGWAEVVARLRSRTMAMTDGKAHPHVVRFKPEAKAAWVTWYDSQVEELNRPDFDANELAVEGKLADFAARLILIIHLLDLACDLTRDPLGPIPEVPKWVVVAALKFWSYFRSHHRRARWFMNGGVGNSDARHILEWIRRNEFNSFTERDLTRNFPRFRDDPGAVSAALEWLARRNAIQLAPAPERPPGTRGRKLGPVWRVNPSIYSPRNCQNCFNSESEANSGNNVNFAAPNEGETGKGDDDTPTC